LRFFNGLRTWLRLGERFRFRGRFDWLYGTWTWLRLRNWIRCGFRFRRRLRVGLRLRVGSRRCRRAIDWIRSRGWFKTWFR
jgi:hypothetical protein